MKKQVFMNKYGKSAKSLSLELNISIPSLSRWDRKGLDIFSKAADLNAMKGNIRLQNLWANIHWRCNNPKDKKYAYYGAKGIRVKIRKSELGYLWKRDNANSMRQPSLDRIDSSGHYELKNCRFIEMEENRKRRDYSIQNSNKINNEKSLATSTKSRYYDVMENNEDKKYQVLTVRFEMPLYQEFRRLAFENNTKMNAYIRDFVKELVEKGKVK